MDPRKPECRHAVAPLQRLLRANDQQVNKYKLRVSLVSGGSGSFYKVRDHVYLDVDLVRRLDDDTSRSRPSVSSWRKSSPTLLRLNCCSRHRSRWPCSLLRADADHRERGRRRWCSSYFRKNGTRCVWPTECGSRWPWARGGSWKSWDGSISGPAVMCGSRTWFARYTGPGFKLWENSWPSENDEHRRNRFVIVLTARRLWFQILNEAARYAVTFISSVWHRRFFGRKICQTVPFVRSIGDKWSCSNCIPTSLHHASLICYLWYLLSVFSLKQNLACNPLRYDRRVAGSPDKSHE